MTLREQLKADIGISKHLDYRFWIVWKDGVKLFYDSRNGEDCYIDLPGIETVEELENFIKAFKKEK